MVQSAPLAALAGTPIYNLYLRLLGAKIGRDTVIAGRLIPVCTDLLSIGDNTIIRKDSIVLGYKAQSNYIHTGSVTIGNNAVVGEASVLEIDTVMGNDTQLGHASSLQSGQRVPDGKHYHGSPAQETTADYGPVEAKRCSSLRRWLYPAIPLTAGLAIFAPAADHDPELLVPVRRALHRRHRLDYGVTGRGPAPAGAGGLRWCCWSARWRSAWLAWRSSRGCSTSCCSRRRPTCSTASTTGCTASCPAPATRASTISCLATARPSSHYLTLIGWNLNKIEQTGSNFGTNQRHDNPFLCEVGSSTMVSDGLSMMNAQIRAPRSG